jgi:hypothetical protein
LLSSKKFIRQSLDLNLFFLRIMKEHSFFLAAGFAPPNADRAKEANNFKNIFTRLLRETVDISYGNVSENVLSSGEILSQYTFDAERATEYFTGITIDSNLTIAESELYPGSISDCDKALERRVLKLNDKILNALSELINFKVNLLEDVLSCSIFTFNYPLLIDHILREARLYYDMLYELQNGVTVNIAERAIEQESFWSRIMAEHAKFIRGLLDPTEETLIATANNFGNEFDALTREAIELNENIRPLPEVTEETLKATFAIRNFKSQGTEGLLNCDIKSIIVPLLADHTLREANHFLRLLKEFRGICIE